jgi:hypothetical protein
MITENARVEVLVRGDDIRFWLDPVINGHHTTHGIPVTSIQHGTEMAGFVERLIKEVYRKAYRDGYSSCQQVINDALGR